MAVEEEEEGVKAFLDFWLSEDQEHLVLCLSPMRTVVFGKGSE